MGEASRRGRRRHELDCRLDSRIASFFEVEPPSPFFHYTSWAGATAILESRQLRATAHDCTNDDHELVSVDQTVLDVLGQLQPDATGSRRRVLALLIDGYEQYKVSRKVPTYLACFSMERDSLVMWNRDYSETGSGLCLAFRFLPDEKPTTVYGLGSTFLRVDYSEESWRRNLLNRFAQILAEIPESEVDLECVTLVAVAMYRVAALAAIQGKQPQWEVEKELRCVAVTARDSAVTEVLWDSGGQSKRGVYLPMRAEGRLPALDEVIIGPRQDQQEARRKLMELLTTVGYGTEDAPMPIVSSSAHLT